MFSAAKCSKGCRFYGDFLSIMILYATFIRNHLWKCFWLFFLQVTEIEAFKQFISFEKNAKSSIKLLHRLTITELIKFQHKSLNKEISGSCGRDILSYYLSVFWQYVLLRTSLYCGPHTQEQLLFCSKYKSNPKQPGCKKSVRPQECCCEKRCEIQSCGQEMDVMIG